jgi:uncharacterized surface protein with fasciclin (FAS1) repeats
MKSLRNLIILIILVSLSATGGYFFYTEILKQVPAQQEEIASYNQKPLPENVIDVILNENLSEFSKVLDKTQLKSLLEEGEFTILVPSNEAFVNFENKNDELEKKLKYHIIEGKFSLKSLIDKQTIETLSGDVIKIIEKTEKTYIEDIAGNQIAILKEDVESQNGMVHIIGRLLETNEI